MTTHYSTGFSRLAQIVNTTLGRLVILVLLVGVVFGGGVVARHFKHDKYAAARQAADSFLTAYTQCDVETAAKYYLTFQTNQTAVESYQKQCVKGAISFAYDSPSAYSSKTTKGVQAIDVALVYSASQRGGTAGKFIVDMRWNSTQKQWTVSSITAAPTSTPTTGTTTKS